LFPADVTSQQQAVAAVEQTVAEPGRLDTVVNSTGVMLLRPAMDTPADDWDQMMPSSCRACTTSLMLRFRTW